MKKWTADEIGALLTEGRTKMPWMDYEYKVVKKEFVAVEELKLFAETRKNQLLLRANPDESAECEDQYLLGKAAALDELIDELEKTTEGEKTK